MPPRQDKKRQVESARKKLRSEERSTRAPAPKKKSFNVKDAAIGAAVGAIGATGAGKGVKVAKVLYKARLLRLDEAKKKYYSFPKGQKELRDKIAKKELRDNMERAQRIAKKERRNQINKSRYNKLIDGKS